MKHVPLLLALAFSLIPMVASAAQSAQARLYCLSLRLQRGPGQTGEYSLDFTTLGAGVNGELAPDFFGNYTHSGYLELRDEFFGERLGGMVVLDIPDSGDANGNGFPDFFEVSQAVSGASGGRYNLEVFGEGLIEASWSRAAESAYGTCVLKFRQNAFTTFDTFTHTFEVLEYTGPLSYTPGTNAVSGTVDLVKSGDPASLLHGPVKFAKSASNAFNLLSIQSGTWTNNYSQPLTYTNQPFERDLSRPTNYFGYMLFDDGEPNTADPDYFVWVLSIDDTHDTNRNGIPDFSDHPASSAPSAPVLSLTRTATNLMLTIKGEVGRAYQVQGTSSLSGTLWRDLPPVTLTNESQAYPLALPLEAVQFWRVLTR